MAVVAGIVRTPRKTDFVMVRVISWIVFVFGGKEFTV
jgi:hypothetical protein